MGTRLESVEEIRRAVQAGRTPTAKEPGIVHETTLFRPLRRPPLALLCILDDGGERGEWVRLRDDRVTIGRSEGQIVIPHDPAMSALHAALCRRVERENHVWYLTDLQSRNGTFVRIGAALLKHNQELMIGSRRYRFDAAPQRAPVADEAAPPSGTSAWQSLAPGSLVPCLAEIAPEGEGRRFPLTRADNLVGRNPTTCAVALGDDPLVSPQHARIYKNSKGRWFVENQKSLNGTWIRIDELALDAACQFMLGEQRFLFRVP
jgi:pSer/pThr/pTyr-binding forkhead associated (FHA) protein